MNSDFEHLYLDVHYNEDCTEALMKLSIFMFHHKLGLKGGKLEGDEALKFLKSTSHGKQPDLINYFYLFSPESMEEMPIKITVEIPGVKDVRYRHNKFDRKKRGFKAATMSIPCIKTTIRTLDELKKLFDGMDPKVKDQGQKLTTDQKEVVATVREYLETTTSSDIPTFETSKMYTALEDVINSVKP